ncbi:hypothetical protein CJ191_08465, partial [Aerococcus viridans]
FILGFHGLFVYPKIVLAEIPKNFPPTLFIIEPKNSNQLLNQLLNLKIHEIRELFSGIFSFILGNVRINI